MFAVPSFFGYNTTFVSTPVATAATGVGSTSFTANWNAFVGASYYLLDVSTSSSFSSFVGSYQNFVVLSTSQLVSGLTASTTYYYRLRAATGVDADAAAFFSRVYTAGGALTYTEVTATETLVSSMKADGTWTPMKAIYPMIGASAAACAQNLKSSSFTGTFTSGWTFASTGVTPNGTSAYMSTGLTPSANLLLDSVHLSAYIRNNTASGGAIGCADNSLANGLYLNPRYTNDTQYSRSNSNAGGGQANTAAAGFWISSRITSTGFKIFKSNTTFATETISTSGRSANPIFVGAVQLANFGIEYSNRNLAFASIGDGLTDTQASNFYTAVQAFQTTLARQVV